MTSKRLAIAEKTVKIAIGVGKLAATGGLSLDTAKTVIDILKDGESLHGKLTPDERLLARGIERAVEQRIAEAEVNPEIARGAAHDLRARFEQALDHAIPEAETLQNAALDAALAPDATARSVIGLMRAQIMAEAPAGLRAYYADPDSADSRFLTAVLFGALQPFFADPAYFDGLGRAISGRMLADLAALKEGQAAQDDMLARILAAVDASGETAAAEAAGVQREAVVRLARRISGSIADFDQALAELDRAVELAIEVRQAGAQGSNLSVFVDDVLRRLADLTAAGEYDEAGEAADAAIAQWERDEAERQARAGAELARLLEAGERQDILRGDAEAAADKIVRRVSLATPTEQLFEALNSEALSWHKSGWKSGLTLDLEVAITLARASHTSARNLAQRKQSLLRLGSIMHTLGEREASNKRLLGAIGIFKFLITRSNRDSAPLEWAAFQDKLGHALCTLGGRERGTDRLEQAVIAFNAALSRRTKARSPLDWAFTHANLSNALRMIGQRDLSIEQLQRAASSARAALTVYNKQIQPQEWAMAQCNLANALTIIGEREAGTIYLEQAVDAFYAAVSVYDQGDTPLALSTNLNNLGYALRALGEREKGTARLERAVDVLNAALSRRDRARVPLEWAQTQNNLGNTLLALGNRESNTAKLELAVTAFEAALTEYTREQVPLEWALSQSNLGDALSAFGQRESGIERLQRAVDAYNAALTERTQDRVPLDWAMSTGNQGVALMVLAGRTGDAAMAARAAKQIAAARDTMQAGGHAPSAAYYEARLPEATALRDRLAAAPDLGAIRDP